MDFKKITDIEFEGIDYSDAPRFCDAFIASAQYKGKEATEKQLDEMSENADFVHEELNKFLY